MTGRSDRIAFLGTGMMGEGMAARLLSAGYAVGVCAHRDRAPMNRLVAAGAEDHDSPADLVSVSGVVMTCLPDSRAVEALFARIGPALQPGTLWIDVTTGDPAATRHLAERLLAQGVRFADAPVTGGPPQAESGDLTSLVGCDEADWADVERFVGCYSKTIRRMGLVSTGHTAKLLNNLVSQGTMVLLGQAFRAARDAGIEWEALYAAMSGGAARSGTLEKAVAPALDGDYDAARFSIRNAAKDLTYAAEIFGPPGSRVAEALRDELTAYVEAGDGDAFVSLQLAHAPGQSPRE